MIIFFLNDKLFIQFVFCRFDLLKLDRIFKISGCYPLSLLTTSAITRRRPNHDEMIRPPSPLQFWIINNILVVDYLFSRSGITSIQIPESSERASL